MEGFAHNDCSGLSVYQVLTLTAPEHAPSLYQVLTLTVTWTSTLPISGPTLMAIWVSQQLIAGPTLTATPRGSSERRMLAYKTTRNTTYIGSSPWRLPEQVPSLYRVLILTAYPSKYPAHI